MNPLDLARETLRGADAWLVGGAVRDRLLGRLDDAPDLDFVIDGDVRAAAKALARAVDGPAFELSDAFGAWRVMARDRSWQADLTPMRGGSLDADLALRDFTINAMAEPLEGGAPVDPFHGARDLDARVLRAVGERSFADDPLRVLRLSRQACELGLEVDGATERAAEAEAARLRDVAQERVFAELKRIVTADAALSGLHLADRTGALAAVLPELGALKGIEQTIYHHRDAHGHTLEVLERAVDLDRDPGAILGSHHAARLRALLDEPLADGLTRGGALRFAALLHDIAKSRTGVPNPKGGFGFPGHDRLGAEMARDILSRLHASERLKRHVAQMTEHHLRAGFLVKYRPLDLRVVHGYLKATEPVEVDVTLLSVADRLATRGRKHEEAIAKHLEVVYQILGSALDWHEHGPPAPLLRGDDLVRELGVTPGPDLGRVLGELAAAQYAGEIATRDAALALARSLV
ncbi:MAG TPA: HD domain-containing protein [Solirubrobacteraceae bacterium]|nr:HD domain-containing protein [Solirubrobacteraceae bacterium]